MARSTKVFDSLIESVKKSFSERFGEEAEGAGLACGRVELLGNHTDYNGGYILASTVDRALCIAGRRTSTKGGELYSKSFDETVTFDLDELRAENHWSDYPKGVLNELQQSGVDFGGFQAVVDGNLPPGSGLSSSAGIEVATAALVKTLYPFNMASMDLARVCQKAENDFVGMGCGLMDQFCAVFGREHAFLFLDCLTLEDEEFCVRDSDLRIVVCNTMVKHALVEGEYMQRRRECESAAEYFAETTGRPIKYLREVSVKDFERYGGGLDEVRSRRAEHIIRENKRVLEATRLLREGDLTGMAGLMWESHKSSSELFENSCPELDLMIELAAEVEGCLGGKLSGGGFGGCTVNLVLKQNVEEFCSHVGQSYENKTGKKPEIHVCRIGTGMITRRFAG
jgi:galactokinase